MIFSLYSLHQEKKHASCLETSSHCYSTSTGEMPSSAPTCAACARSSFGIAVGTRAGGGNLELKPSRRWVNFILSKIQNHKFNKTFVNWWLIHGTETVIFLMFVWIRKIAASTVQKCQRDDSPVWWLGILGSLLSFHYGWDHYLREIPKNLKPPRSKPV